jgi:hypothetical protein
VLAGVLFVMALAVPARGQERGQVGVTMAYPTTIGVIWHISDAIAVRPEFGFAWTSNDASATTSSSTTFSVGASGIFYVKKWESLRAYVSPRYAYQHGSNSANFDLASVLPPSIILPPSLTLPSLQTTVTNTAHSASGAFGAQYTLHQHFGIFGEIGAAYAHTTSSVPGFVTSLISTSTTGNAVAVRSSVGAIFYF